MNNDVDDQSVRTVCMVWYAYGNLFYKAVIILYESDSSVAFTWSFSLAQQVNKRWMSKKVMVQNNTSITLFIPISIWYIWETKLQLFSPIV